MQLNLTGFLERNTGAFMGDLWGLCISAQENFIIEKGARLSIYCVRVCVCVCVCARVCDCVCGRVFLWATCEVGGWGRVPFSRNLMSPTPRRKWYLTTGRRFH